MRGIIVIGALVLGIVHAVAAGEESQVARGAYVVLAYDGSGDFGYETPDTRTAGWQEALDHCVAAKRDLYVKGGFGGIEAVYHIEETIRIPAAQDFRIDGGVYVINYRGAHAEDALVIDSAMNCEYQIGIVVYGGRGAGIRIRPTEPVPIDGFPIVTETQIRCQSIADPRPFVAGERKFGTGLVIDTGHAEITYNKMYFTAILNFHRCIELVDSGYFHHNEFVCEHLHTNAHDSELTYVGKSAFQNVFRFGIGVDLGATGVQGVELAGRNNVLELGIRHGGFRERAELILTESARGNQINLRTDRRELDAIITDRAATPTNQVTYTGPPPPIRFVRGETGTWAYTQRLYPAVVSVVEGDVDVVVFERSGERIEYGEPAGRDFQMSVADRLEVRSDTPPVLRVVPIKVR